MNRDDWVWYHVVSLLFLNVVDCIFTLYWVKAGLALEANPVMAYFLDIHPLLFVIIKHVLVSAGGLILWTYRRKTLSMIGVMVSSYVYFLIVLYHLAALSLSFVGVK